MVADFARMRLFRAVRRFSQVTQDWETAVRYMTLPDERFDLTKVSARVYGTRDESLVIQAAAGLDSPELELTERRLVLPTADQLAAMKKAAGYDLAPSPRATDAPAYVRPVPVEREAPPGVKVPT